MCTDNCGWTVTPAKPQHPNLDPVFAPDFESHMKGTIKSGEHTGCHTLYGRAQGERVFEQKKGGGDHKVLNTATNGKIYSAKIGLKKNETRRGVPEFTDLKLSSFWPDDMCLECVKQAIIYAWKNYKGAMGQAVKHKGQADEMAREIKDTPVKWAGKVSITKGTDSFRIWVGSPETGESNASAIYSAYPKVTAKFF